MTQVIQTMVVVFGCLGALLLILLALPASKFRDVLLPILAWTFAAFFALTLASPVDVLPELILGPLGLIDDAAALAGLIAAVTTARTFRKSTEQAPIGQLPQVQKHV